MLKEADYLAAPELFEAKELKGRTRRNCYLFKVVAMRTFWQRSIITSRNYSWVMSKRMKLFLLTMARR